MKKLLLIGIFCSTFLNAENISIHPFHIGIDYLYWKTAQDDMDYGYTTTTKATTLSEDLSNLEVNSSTVDVAKTKIIRTNFKYESGFRIHLGYESPCSGIDCNVSYTYLPNSVKKNTVQTSTETISSIFTTLPLSRLRAKWTSSFNQIDVDFSRNFHFGTLMNIDPHIGIRGVIANQHFYARSDFTSAVITGAGVGAPPVGTNAIFNEFKQNFYGVGIEGGLWASINLGCGISLLGHCGGAILCSKFNVKNESEGTIIAQETSTPTTVNYDKDTIWTQTPVLDYFIGLECCRNFCKSTIHLYAGWEQHVFFDMNRLQVGGDEYGNFSVAGLTAGIDVLF